MERKLLKAGLRAVSNYVTCAGFGTKEDSTHERSLSAFMAIELYKILRINARPEWAYSKIVEDSENVTGSIIFECNLAACS